MRKKLEGKMKLNDIYEICFMTQSKENDRQKEELYRLTFDEDNRVAFNALHALSHFDLTNNITMQYSCHS